MPTLIAYGEMISSHDAVQRALRMLDWLVSIQFPDGSFQGGMIGQEPRVPVTFNTGQILMGLTAGARINSGYREPMRRAADWLISTQDADGCWRRYPTPFATKGEKTYDTHVALALLDAARIEPTRGYREAALKQIDWALGNQLNNGWLASCCLNDPANPLTHTLGYALRGIVGAWLETADVRYLRAACLTANGLMGALDEIGKLPGRLNANWQAAANWVCLTGSSQIAESWLILYNSIGHAAYRNAAQRANAFVRRTISVEGPRETRGAVRGSFPVGGEYGRWQYLSWACKFMIDANRAELALTNSCQ